MNQEPAHNRVSHGNLVNVAALKFGEKVALIHHLIVRLRFECQGIREISEVCILTVGHSPESFRGSLQSVAADCYASPARTPLSERRQLARVHCCLFGQTFWTSASKTQTSIARRNRFARPLHCNLVVIKLSEKRSNE